MLHFYQMLHFYPIFLISLLGENSITEKIKADFYVKRKSKLIENFNKKLENIKSLFIEYFDEKSLTNLYDMIFKEFETLLPEIQYIGGNKNPYTSFLVGSAEMFAIIRIFQNEGLSFQKIGQFIFEYYEIINQRREEVLKKAGQLHSEQIFTPDYMDFMKNFAKESQNKTYPGDWIFEFVDGTNEFNYGFNFTQCGICELSKKLDFERYTPFICLADFAEATASGFGFTRTQTVSNGDPICDHRYIKDVTTPRAWPPEKMQEFKLKF